MKYRRFSTLISVCCCISLLALGFMAKAQLVMAAIVPGRTIVLDAGHGGFDPGAVGANDTNEAEINLNIVLKLRAELEARGYGVILTRENNDALGGTKQEDMQKRREIIANSGADYTISIHLNANRDHSCYGPVALYHPTSEVGRQLAEKMQATLNAMLTIARPRIMQSGSYFILNSGPMPSIIVECGFITNLNDEALLRTPEYQAKVANAIACGLDEFITDQVNRTNSLSPSIAPSPK